MTFPAIVPSARTYTPGDVPQNQQLVLSGAYNAYRVGNRRITQSLNLSFNNISESQLNEIRNHYIAQDGSFGIFYLSAEVWSGYASPPVPLLSDYAWRYASAPTITDGSRDLWSVEVELVTYAINFTDLIFDAGDAAAIPARTYILDASGANAAPARDYVINAGAAV